MFSAITLVAVSILTATFLFYLFRFLYPLITNMEIFEWNEKENFFKLPFEIDGIIYTIEKMFPNDFHIKVQLKNRKVITISLRYTCDIEFDILGRPIIYMDRPERKRMDGFSRYYKTIPLLLIHNGEYINPNDIAYWRPANMSWNKFERLYLF